MRPVEADFNKREGPPRWAFTGLCLGLLCALALVAWAWGENRALALAQLHFADRAREADSHARGGHRVATPPPYQASARRLLTEHMAPWPQALADLEGQRLRGVVVLAIDYAAPDDVVRIEVSAARMEGLLQFVDNLNQGSARHAAPLKWSIERLAAEPDGGQRLRAAVLARRSAP